ncbi:uncharacterized protein SPPG_03745 [Spizellomyces punctatus DAOM BR117]|uniref:Protein Lines N-terminal domain-containing protein n=1 Tax=Spizellomyces punctatus (strain DAOM BR117) TaxID=645134 RepID=A0A0L0HHQ7_SPIPD|nr:uncharacterized protein SPPG_03745 [Spizellomyces punctatus DAOM BR117]KND00617.1 hypothetical protein SPPG_03745 [Spizellomyces punctatus DAOM BR117]|eukprot:XP_016608656.1 hypothetical protein SPPG_03745 [Spizellomyces punctatus DAOM BR117]
MPQDPQDGFIELVQECIQNLSTEEEATDDQPVGVLYKFSVLADAAQQFDDPLGKLHATAACSNVLILLSRGFTTKHQHAAFTALKILETIVCSESNKFPEDRSAADALAAFFAHLVSNLRPSVQASPTDRSKIHNIMYSLDFLQRILKHCRTRMKRAHETCPFALLYPLAIALADKDKDGRVGWMSVLFMKRTLIPPETLSHYIALMHGIVKTNIIVSARSDGPDPTIVATMLSLIRYMKAHVPSLGTLLEDCSPYVRRKTLELLHTITTSNGDMVSIILLLDHLYRCLDHIHNPSFTEWWTRTITDDYTEFFLDPSHPIDRESLKICVNMLLEALSAGMRDFSGPEITVERKRFMFLLDRFSVGFADVLRNSNLRTYLFQLYGDNDAQLFGVLSIFIQLYIGVQQDEIMKRLFPTITYALHTLNPHALWIHFSLNTNNDPETLLDFLISGETGFLEYFVKYLRFILSRVEAFRNMCQRQGAMEVQLLLLSGLKDRVESLWKRGLFPYEPGVLVKRLDDVISALSG